MERRPTQLPVSGLPCGFQVAAADGEFVLDTGVPISSGVALGGQSSGPTARLGPGVRFVVTEAWAVAQPVKPEVGGEDGADEKPAGVDLLARSSNNKALARFLKAGCVTRLLIREDPSHNVPAGWTSLNSDADLSVMLCNLVPKAPCEFHADGT